MTEYEDILKRLKGLSQSVVPCIPAVVKSVEVVTCTVVLMDGLELAGVRLKAGNDNGSEFVRMKPRPKSIVLIAQVGDDETAGEYYVAAYNEVDEVMVKMSDTLVIVNKDSVSAAVKDSSYSLTKDNAFVTVGAAGNQSKITVSKTEILLEPKLWLTVQNSQANLKSVLQDLISVVRDLSVVVTGTAGPNPVTGTGFTSPAQKTQLSTILVKLSNLLN